MVEDAKVSAMMGTIEVFTDEEDLEVEGAWTESVPLSFAVAVGKTATSHVVVVTALRIGTITDARIHGALIAGLMIAEKAAAFPAALATGLKVGTTVFVAMVLLPGLRTLTKDHTGATAGFLYGGPLQTRMQPLQTTRKDYKTM